MSLDRLCAFIRTRQQLLLMTGAGVSTASGIPDYRDLNGAWKRQPPMYYQNFAGDPAARQRYWARSMLGWPLFARARPSASHRALADLQRLVQASLLVTQNVDGLHQAAGSEPVLDLHGRLDRVVCLGCRRSALRADFQQRLVAANAGWSGGEVHVAPDGDADLAMADYSRFAVPACEHCGGILKPDVVFYGENVPRDRVQRVRDHLAASDGVLVVGSSLMVWSGFRFVRAAAQCGVPVMAINRGRTRADDLFQLKLERDSETVLPMLVRHLQRDAGPQ